MQQMIKYEIYWRILGEFDGNGRVFHDKFEFRLS